MDEIIGFRDQVSTPRGAWRVYTLGTLACIDYLQQTLNNEILELDATDPFLS